MQDYCCSYSLIDSIIADRARVNLEVAPEINLKIEVSNGTSSPRPNEVRIAHNMAHPPKPTVFDSQGRYVEIAYRYEPGSIVFEPNGPFTGTVYLS